MSINVCRLKTLPLDKAFDAERRAIELNPANRADARRVVRTPIGRRGGPRRIAVVIARKWPATGVRLSVSFLDNPHRTLRSRILSHMNAWGDYANVRFSETSGVGEVRIARLDAPEDMAGYWSYLGTEILDAPEGRPTLNLEGFTMRTLEADFRRVVRHEAGHTLGFDHEHMRSDIVMRIDRKKVFAYFDRKYGWPPEEVEAQVLTPLEDKSLMGTKASDPVSIMCYQLPASVMRNRKAVLGGADINARDGAFAGELYPKVAKRASLDPGKPILSLPTLVVATGRQDDHSEQFELTIMDDFNAGTRRKSGYGKTPKYAQMFATYRGARVTASLQLRAEKGEPKTGFGDIIQMHERIKAYTNRSGGSLPDDQAMLQFGTQLFNTLLQGDVRRLYDEARTLQKRQLEVVFTSMIPWIGEKPWEFAYDAGRQSFLATEDVRFIRNVLTNIPADSVIRPNGPLRILIASAQPVGFGHLSIQQEEVVIRRGFQSLVDAHLVTIETLPRATPRQLHDKLATASFQIVHFIGHGVYDDERQEGCLIFVNELGGEQYVGQRSLREIFCNRGLSLVFLNACETGRGGRADFNKGVAQSLVAHGLPALVANQYSVLDASATSFAQHFYCLLAQGLSIGRAAREARIAVNYSLQGEPIDWAVPVVYAREGSMTLCDLPPADARAAAPAPAIRSSMRRATERHAVRVGVWDMDNAFPTLERTLAQLTSAQSEFGFELADLSVPLDVWYREQGDRETYLHATKLAHRLRWAPVELGVHVLACFTRHWMRSEKTLNIYGWWPADREPSIIIYSVAGFPELKPEGAATDRFIANELVGGLSGFFAELGTHPRRNGGCPLYFNKERDFQHLIHPQRFDAGCRRKLQIKIGPQLKALDTLLQVFV
jgi:hypothetical protein